MSTGLYTQVKHTSTQTPPFISTLLLQRKCADIDCRNKELLQRDVSGPTELSKVPHIVHEVLNSPGEPLDREIRAFMEPRFGHDFSKVQVHTDARSAESARAVNALAYTVGQNIVFGEGQHAPETHAGKNLLAHELIHVIQQGSGAKSMQARLDLTHPDDYAEREAKMTSRAVMRGEILTPSSSQNIQVARDTPDAGAPDAGRDKNPISAAPENAPPTKKTPTALEQAEALVKESPTTVKDQAAWILRAADQGFVTFNTTKARENVENLRDEKKVENLDPKAAGYNVPILEVEVRLAKHVAQRWIDAKGVGDKPSIQFGSMIRSVASGGPHSKGKAIDINALKMATTVDATIVILNDLDKDVHSYYGLGFPFQGDFFDSTDNLETKKAAAESKAAALEKPKTETGGGTAGTPGAGARPEEKTEAQPMTATVKDAVKKFVSPIYQSTGTRGADGKWTWQDSTQDAIGAYKLLKSQKLKDTLASRRKDGFRFDIFPDNDDHLHLDAR